MKAFTGVVNIYIDVHMVTNLSKDNYQIWASGERKRKHIDSKRPTLVQTSMLSLIYMPQQPCNDVSSIFIHYAMLWITYGFTNRYLWIIFVILFMNTFIVPACSLSRICCRNPQSLGTDVWYLIFCLPSHSCIIRQRGPIYIGRRMNKIKGVWSSVRDHIEQCRVTGVTVVIATCISGFEIKGSGGAKCSQIESKCS